MDRIIRKAPVTLGLVFINIVLFLFVETHGGSADTGVMVRYGALYWPRIERDLEYWRLLTAAFLHFGVEHLGNNMLLLFLLGDNLERALGSVKFLVLYLVSAVAANLVSVFTAPEEELYHTVGAGASGAVFAVIGGLIWAIIRNKGQLEDLSVRQMLIFAALSVYYSAVSANVDNAAHLGGLAAGFLLSVLLYRRPGPEDRWYRGDGRDGYGTL